MTNNNLKLAQEINTEVSSWVDSSFNYIHVDVLNKCCNNTLYEYIRALEPTIDDYEDYLCSYDIDKLKTIEDYKEFVKAEELQSDFDNYMSGQENYPMWDTCFEFRNEPSEDEIQNAINAGFGIIEGLDDFNTLLFVCGAGYSFYGAHWIPLYLATYKEYNEELKKYDNVNYSMM